MAAKNCEDCGVKLTMLNRHMKYREKCHPCGHKEFVRVKEERDKERDKARAARGQVECLTYLGGFSGVTSQQSLCLHFGDATQVTVETTYRGKDKKIYGRVLWAMPYDKIKDIRIDTAENLSAARLLLVGIIALGLKKKEHYLVVSFEDEYGLIQNPVFHSGKNGHGLPVLNKISERIYEGMGAARAAQPQQPQVEQPQQPQVEQPQQPQTATIDVTEQIKKLGELRDQGLLTEQEFDSKKQELLARM